VADDNPKDIVKPGKPGRPTVITPETIKKLESVFQLGVTDEVACDYAEIAPSTFYDHLNKDEDFRRKMRAAKNYARIAAGAVVVEAIKNKDVNTARWWLEKKYPNEFCGRVDSNSLEFRQGDRSIIFKVTRGE